MRRQAMATAAMTIALAGGGAQAQSLEKSYADQCSTAAAKKSEMCQVMAKALVAKLQGEAGDNGEAQHRAASKDARTSASSSPVSPSLATMKALRSDGGAVDPRWGVLARLSDTYWATDNMSDGTSAQPPVLRNFVTFSFLENGAALEVLQGVEPFTGGPNVRTVLRPGATPGTFEGTDQVTLPDSTLRNVQWSAPRKLTLRTDDKGGVVSDWYKALDKGPYNREAYARKGVRLMPDGSLALVGAFGYERDRPALSDPDDPTQGKLRLRPYDRAAYFSLAQEYVLSVRKHGKIDESEQQIAALNAHIAQREQEFAARAAANRKFIGKMVLVGAGLAAVGAAHGASDQAVGAVMKGVQSATPGSNAATFSEPNMPTTLNTMTSAQPRTTSQKAATYSFCVAYGSKVAYLSPVFQTREAWLPPVAARAFKAQLESGVRDPECAGALSEATASAQRAAILARDGKAMRIVDVPFSW